MWSKFSVSNYHMFATKKFGIGSLYVCCKKIWKLTPMCLLRKNLEINSYMFATKKFVIGFLFEIGSYMFATKKFGNQLLYVCYEKIWNWESICLLQKNLEIYSYMFATKKFGNQLLYICYEKICNWVSICLLHKNLQIYSSRPLELMKKVSLTQILECSFY